MKLAFFYPDRAINRPINPDVIWSDHRGLTGSEMSCIMHAIHQHKLGNEVTLYTKITFPGNVEGVNFEPYYKWDTNERYRSCDWDGLFSCMNTDPFPLISNGALRVFNQQVSDFQQCSDDWPSRTDLIAPLSHSHSNYLKKTTDFPENKWRILYNGVNVNEFKPGKKIPGKMIWASSHDRGLHWLLEAFPKIREAVPYANLHIFYDFSGVEAFKEITDNYNTNLVELGFRSRYVLEAIRKLEGKGVYVHKSVSRNRMIQEMASAQILPYPLDPVHYTETFGCTVLEACASGTVPVICNADAFGELWSPVSLSVPSPYPEHKDEFIDLVVRILQDDSLRSEMSSKCVNYAKKFSWESLAIGLNEAFQTSGRQGLSKVSWDHR